MASFHFFPSYWEALRMLDDSEVGRVVKAMCEVTFEGREPEISGVPALIFSVIRPNVEHSFERSVAGETGGRKAGRGRPSKGSSKTASKAKSKQPNRLIEDSLIAERSGAERNGTEKKSFSKPSLEEIRAYVSDHQLIVDVDHFYNYYESNGWRVGRNPMKDWKATLRSWNARNKGGASSGYRRDGEPATYSPSGFEG